MLVTAEHTLKHHNSKKACMLNSILPILRITIGNLPIYTSAEIYKGTFDISSTNKSSEDISFGNIWIERLITISSCNKRIIELLVRAVKVIFSKYRQPIIYCLP